MKAGRALPGTSYNTRAAKWQARIAVDGVRKHLGYFDTPEQAHAAYAAAKWEAGRKRRVPKPRSPSVDLDVAALVKRAVADMVLAVFERVDASGGTLTPAQALREVAAQASIADLI